MSDGRTIETDWEQIERFVQDIDATNSISDIQRQFLKQRLESPEDHIVLITISVLDCVVINCSRGVRDQLATAKWMKVLLECFVKNLNKLPIRNALQQLFSNWRALLKHEALGKEAKNVCRSMQSKNYVVPPPMEYSTAVKQLIESGVKPTEFQKGVDFLDEFYGATLNAKSAESSSSIPTEATAYQPPPEENTAMDTIQQELMRQAVLNNSGAPVVVDVVQQMQDDASSLLAATMQCEQATQAMSVEGSSRPGVLEEKMSLAMEAAAKCSSWTDQIQKMIEDGLDGDAIMEVLRVNEGLNAALQQWKNTSEKLPRRSQLQSNRSPTYGRPTAAVPALETSSPAEPLFSNLPGPSSRTHSFDTALPAPSNDIPLIFMEDTAGRRDIKLPERLASPVALPSSPVLSSGNPFSSPDVVAGVRSTPAPQASASVQAPAMVPSVVTPGPAINVNQPTESARHAGGEVSHLEVELLRLREDMGGLRQQHEEDFRRCQDAARQEAQELRLQVTWLQQRLSQQDESKAQDVGNVGPEGSAAQEKLEGKVRNLEGIIEFQQKQITELVGAFESITNALKARHPEHDILVGGDTRGPPRHTTSGQSLQRTITRRSLASVDSFSAVSLGSFPSAQAGNSFTTRDGGSFSEATPAEMLSAYRKMPALRVRFTPQHFANVVSTVSSEWLDDVDPEPGMNDLPKT